MLQIQEKDEKLFCVFSGPQNTPACKELEADLLARLKATQLPVVFDLQTVEFVSSMFLRLCLMAVQKVGAEKFSVTNTQPPVKKVFKIAGFDKQIKIE
ncbi:MAG: STAS domain-containing protein [Verrucomicrobiae bacterium]|nr:STAS domain-containing protein [Verrucomicrobiae bacterium]